MKKRLQKVPVQTHIFDTPIPWLPVDSRLFPFIGFGSIRGWSRVFLTIEISIAFFSVVLSLLLFVTHLLGA